MGNLAIIPARGGSKRIPRKNIRDFLGKPIISYSIEAALESGLFEEVMVSTDDEEIAEVARKYGAKVPFFRSKENSDDFATTASVLIEVLSRYEEFQRTFDNVCCIYPCAPLLNAKTLVAAYRNLLQGFDTVLPVVCFGFPIQRALKISGAQVFWESTEYALKRSQDLEPRFHDCGQFYWFDAIEFKSNGALITKNTGYIVLKDTEVQDIDNEVDWQLAELKYKLMHGMAN
ncbi:pseudaminic acid cytidylyltransferase [Robiginitalea sp. M366]|uniref:pseudaminic acid cytidylyltransferase n=1 Tax=Robiginitalea aestuariiviva TaxID=3036903 RepID=UPI00240D52EB|nr:pseudaminic acid cytidylyltransferase [Robiginitalea aestuariiviva]MDG1571479.1 pseudaminic acid cytidylyltransferase [Robiginitalea aestuariiviva]